MALIKSCLASGSTIPSVTIGVHAYGAQEGATTNLHKDLLDLFTSFTVNGSIRLQVDGTGSNIDLNSGTTYTLSSYSYTNLLAFTKVGAGTVNITLIP